MEVGVANRAYVDVTEHVAEAVLTDDEGWGAFRCRAGSVSVWVPAEARA